MPPLSNVFVTTLTFTGSTYMVVKICLGYTPKEMTVYLETTFATL